MAAALSDVSSALKRHKLSIMGIQHTVVFRAWICLSLQMVVLNLLLKMPVMKFKGRSTCAQRRHGHIFVSLSSLNNKYTCGKQRVRERLGIPCKDNLRENRFYKRSDFVSNIIRVNFGLVDNIIVI